MEPAIDHVHITVTDLPRAERFYDQLLPLLGFDFACKERTAVPAHEYELVEYQHARMAIGLVSCRAPYLAAKVSRRRPGALHHLAFRAAGPAEVDALFDAVRRIPGAAVVHPPRLYPDYCADYYAFFFKDSENIEYEVVSFDRGRYFP